MHLIILRPPSNIDAELEGFRRLVFQATGFASAFAFPPVIILAWYEDEPDPEGLPDIQATGLRLGELSVSPEGLFVRTEPAPLIGDLRAACPPGAGPGLIPDIPGVFVSLQERELSPGESDKVSSLEVPALGWRTSTICCYRLDLGEDPSRWWEHLVVEELWRKRLRKNRD